MLRQVRESGKPGEAQKLPPLVQIDSLKKRPRSGSFDLGFYASSSDGVPTPHFDICSSLYPQTSQGGEINLLQEVIGWAPRHMGATLNGYLRPSFRQSQRQKDGL
jgi:hypothetical protein